MIIDFGTLKIYIELEKGVYSYYDNSGAGKTYLCKILEDYIEYSNSNKILIITYRNVNAEDKYDVIMKYLTENSYDLIIVDRADLFITDEMCEALNNSGAIVLVDIKRASKAESLRDEVCLIDFSLGKIRVYD